MSTLQLAINPFSWSNDDMPALGGHIPLHRNQGREQQRRGI
jgi:hypothetical protein